MEAVAVGVQLQRLVGAAEAEEVRHDRTVRGHELGNDLAVEVRPRRLAVQHEHGRPLALVQVVHPQAVLLDVVRQERVPGEVGKTLVGSPVGAHASERM